MMILIDECLPVDLRHSFPTHEAHTAQWAGLKGEKNGDLLRAAEAAGYDALLTIDQGIPYQQNPEGRMIAIIVLRARTNQLEDLLPLVGPALEALESLIPGQVVTIPSRE